jgi:hypothetical protein
MVLNTGEPRKAMDRVLFRAGDPLKALGDVRTVRAYLDEREVEFVKWARQQGKSWTEIAAVVGTSRQSAWERWSDLDDGE